MRRQATILLKFILETLNKFCNKLNAKSHCSQRLLPIVMQTRLDYGTVLRLVQAKYLQWNSISDTTYTIHITINNSNKYHEI
jgi:hypothetical protein